MNRNTDLTCFDYSYKKQAHVNKIEKKTGTGSVSTRTPNHCYDVEWRDGEMERRTGGGGGRGDGRREQEGD